MLLEKFFETVYLPRRLRGKSERSTILYRLCINRFSETVGHKATIFDLTEDNVLAHLARRSRLGHWRCCCVRLSGKWGGSRK